MARFNYFADIDGKAVQLQPKSVFVSGRDFFGTPEGFTPVWTGEGWDRRTVKATRAVEMKANPSRHECDARCTGATGRVMKCECSCGGKNHGRGAFTEG